ncbi:hypothetical protein HUE87_07355 [Candidatus Sulfurimonas marisnigri]|uniref:Uncharacterized protein n=1 Tax=Candidatus Sulfurimonas marisnigri TaxID=2740405 RepID=A0A7S7LYF9_9BACT|nr:hypothetical protein [Candidatus Sulfurimonas marisnigri]QOY53721.1 hypothetical protein HUE87_07355 [Candidatus Sulfurimonas marisnigri]
MIQMFNSIKNLIQFGNNTQTNNISINPKIDVSIRRIEKDFFDGNFKQAIDDLDSLITDNSNESLKSVKYQLLVLKASYLMQFRKIDEFREVIELIETKYKDFIEIKFKEFKLTLMAFNKNKEFFEFSKQLRLETPNSKPQGHFDIVFYLNSGDVPRAKEVFEKEIINTQYRDKLLLIGGHIYSNLYEYNNNDINIFNNADKYYREALETKELSFLDKLQIKGFYATYLLNSNIQNKIPNRELLFSVEDYKKSLDIVLENEKYFNVDYMKIVIENYIHILVYLGFKDEYNEFYKKYENFLSIKHYIQYSGVNEVEYEHNKIQEYILKKQELNDLLVYSSLILNSSDNNIEEITKFLQTKTEYLFKHTFIPYAYVKGQILLHNEIATDLIKYLEEHKYNDIDTLLAFIETAHYTHAEISNKDIDKLIEFSLNDNTFQARILDVIKLLKKLDRRREYLDLALNKQDIFSSIIFETLKICEKDENLYFKDFEYFISNIQNQDYYSAIIGNIYLKHDKPDKAFNYYYLESKKNDNQEAMFALLKVIWDHFNMSHKIIENSKQIEIFNLLIAKREHLKLEDLIFLLMYAIHILKDTRQILPILNQELLNLDIKNLDNSIQVMLSNIFTQTSFGVLSNYNDMFLYDANLCLVQDSKTYFQNNFTILEENKNNFGLHLVDDNDYFLKIQDNTCKKESLFHRLVGPFAFRCENPNMIEMKLDKDSEDPLHELFDFMNQRTNYTKDLFQRYSDEIHIGLYALAHDYKNYFTLIPYILNNKTINLNSLHINYLPKERKKILTLSSIIFLNEINQLEVVLKREDIVIQQTLVNWLKDYSQKVDYTNMPQDFTYLDEESHKFIPVTDDSIKQAETFKASIFKIINAILVCEIIDDTSENLPIKKTYSMLAPHIGGQEYKALAYCINHNYQIISENNVFDMLFDTMKYNKVFISNSIALLAGTLKRDTYRGLIIDLHMKKYKYVLNENYVDGLLDFMKKHDVSNLIDEEKELIKIANNYGFLDKIKQYYRNKFKVLYPKTVPPIKTDFDKNIEKIFSLIEIKIQNV